MSKIDKSRHNEMKSLRGYMVSFSHSGLVCLMISCMLTYYIRFVRALVAVFFSSRFCRVSVLCVPFLGQRRRTGGGVRNVFSNIMLLSHSVRAMATK